MTKTSKLSVVVEPFDDQVCDAAERTEKYGPSLALLAIELEDEHELRFD